MKKEKLFKVGIINESTIDVVKDMTTFYTSDTELWLGFELIEEGVEFDSAEILMFNIDNKSFVVRSVAKTDDKYWYELDMDMIAHHGEWKTQLQFTRNSEVYTSKHFNFRIENDLSNERPPKLIDITNWSNIKQTADSLIAEMKVAVTEAIKAESERQTAFETNESERDRTFESNEATRQAQELEREKSETTRQTLFDGNEAIRFETFNTNEATRQENETTRQQAETERESAESSRVSAEEQRKTDHENRSAELAGKADKKQEDWITPTLLNGWVEDPAWSVGFMKDEFGFVHLKGMAKDGTGTQLLQLPVGYIPAQNSYFVCSSGRNTSTQFNILITRAGGVHSYATSSRSEGVIIDSVIFRAEG